MVLKRDREAGDEELLRNFKSFSLLSLLILLEDRLVVIKSVCVKERELVLPENKREVAVEVLKDTFDFVHLGRLAIDKVVDTLACLEGVLPFA